MHEVRETTQWLRAFYTFAEVLVSIPSTSLSVTPGQRNPAPSTDLPRHHTITWYEYIYVGKLSDTQKIK